ncbi:MAG: rRNA maturation RNase YbeY [Bacteroidales bacterium]
MESFSSIDFHFEEVEVPGFDEDAIREWINRTIISEEQQTGTLNFIFCTDSYLLDLNQKYLDHNTLTDIITFDYTEELEGISGDIFISTERVQENAAQMNVPFTEELNRVIIHGVLHLLGYPDKTDSQKARMRNKENYYLTLRS